MIRLSKTFFECNQTNIGFLLNVRKCLIKTINRDFKKKIKNTYNRKVQKSTNDLMTSKNDTSEVETVSRDSKTSTFAAVDAASIYKLSTKIPCLEYRYFEDVKSGLENTNQSPIKNGEHFTIMSYNILAQDLLELHPYLYLNHSSEALQWNNRLQRLSDEIVTLRPDVLCLQEIQQNHLEMILDKLKCLNFEYVYKKKTGSRTDGCAIFFNRNLFNLINHHAIEFYQPNIEHLDRENVAIVAQFSLKSHPNAFFLVSTTHLLYNPRRQDVRLAQVQVLLAELDRLSVKEIHQDGPRRIPIILAGDFNLQPYSAPYNLITKGSLYYYNLTHYTLDLPTDSNSQNTGYNFLPPRLGITDNCQHFDLLQNQYKGKTRLRNSENHSHFEENPIKEAETDEELIKKYPHLFSSGKLQHKLNLVSVYNHKARDGDTEGTTFQHKWITVDYIFFNKQFNNVNSIHDCCLELLARYTLPTVFQCKKIGTIPNSQLGSDHLSLAAKFFLHVP